MKNTSDTGYTDCYDITSDLAHHFASISAQKDSLDQIVSDRSSEMVYSHFGSTDSRLKVTRGAAMSLFYGIYPTW